MMTTLEKLPTEERLLLDQVRAGNHNVYEQIISRYWDRIYARVFKLLKNHQDAEEITQDAFIRAHRGLDKFRGDASFSTWLYQIATNLAHNRYWYWNRRKRDVSISIDKSIGDNESSTTLEEVLPSGSEGPAEITLTNEFVAKIDECLLKLNEKHRQILDLRIKKDLSYEDIAQILGISVGTVKSRIARARESLKEKLGSDFA